MSWLCFKAGVWTNSKNTRQLRGALAQPKALKGIQEAAMSKAIAVRLSGYSPLHAVENWM